MATSEGGFVIALFLGVAIVVWLVRRWVSPYLDEAITIRNSQINGEPYEPPDPRSARSSRYRLSCQRGVTLLTLLLLPFAMLADPRVWLRDVMSDCAEANSASLRVLIVISHICSAPNRICVVWFGRCRKLIRLLPR